MEDNILI